MNAHHDSMTRTEAASIFVDHYPNLAIRGLERDVTNDDGIRVVYWTCELFDPLDEDGYPETIGTAAFPEHWPVVETYWA